MTESKLPPVDDPSATDRRTFLARASALSLMIPAAGMALTACSPGGNQESAKSSDTARGAPKPSGDQAHNSDSRLDSAVLKGEHRVGTSATGAAAAAANVAYHRWDPALPPVQAGGKIQLNWHAREAPVRISDDTVLAGWTFEGDIPGPIVHCRVGDTVDFTLTNDADIPHSMDFHAAQSIRSSPSALCPRASR